MKVQTVGGFEFTVSNLDIPNAYATGDGQVHVTRAAMELLTTDELTAVLAHEHAHVAHKHVAMKKAAMSCGQLVAMALVVRAVRRRSLKQGIVHQIVFTAVNHTVLNSLTYLQERSADNAARDAGLGEHLASALQKIAPDAALVGVLWLKGDFHGSTTARGRRVTK